MPTRMFHVSLTQPTSGSTSNPGIAHSDATENPVARALGGIASDSDVINPGPMIDNDATIKQLTPTAT